MILEFEIRQTKASKGLRSYFIERKGLPVGRLHLIDDYRVDGKIMRIECESEK